MLGDLVEANVMHRYGVYLPTGGINVNYHPIIGVSPAKALELRVV
jgi:hypothetical protein